MKLRHHSRRPALMASTRNTGRPENMSPLSEGEAVDTRRSPGVEVIKDAERIFYREKWRICEERAAEQLAGTRSLKWIRLFPESTVIWVVALDGVVIGQLRRSAGRWIATGIGKHGPVADCGTFRAALRALACEAWRC
jgi:hypothetical protein